MKATMTTGGMAKLRFSVRFFYDLQAMRVAAKNRGDPRTTEHPVELDDDDKAFIASTGEGLGMLEKQALKEIERIGKSHPMWDWVKSHKGIGPTLAGFLLAEFNPHRAERPSSFWKFAGLHVDEGRNPRPKKGQKLDYNSRVRAKMLGVLGPCLLKASNPDYRPTYDVTKEAKEAQSVTCMACEGVGVCLKKPSARATPEIIEGFAKRVEEARELVKRIRAIDAGDLEGKVTKAQRKRLCWNCSGESVASWGRGTAHRHAHATRLMVKDFLADFWRVWRLKEGLPVVPRYGQRLTDGEKHPHRGRYGTMADGKPYSGPAYPDEQGFWPPEFGWPRERRPEVGKRDRFGRIVNVEQLPDSEFGD